MKLPALFSAACLLTTTAAWPASTDFFESRIRPVLAQECYECHSTAGKKKGGLLLDSRPGWLAGGESGQVIVPGDARKSLLIQTIRHEHEDLKMPKAGAKLEDKVVADFEKWINEGAPDPRDAPPSKEQAAKETEWKAVLERRKDWWAFKAIASPAAAEQQQTVDAFIEAKLAEQGLQPAGPADAATILRRLHYIITGLPPSPEEIAAFKPADLSTTVDKLLASPRYGEKWARHWMDWLRYAESYGSEGDPAIPYAWRYRDYLIRAFNDDVAYPQMVREAVAGDLLPTPRIKNGINESALGIAQLRMVLHGFSPVDSLDEMVTFTENQIDTVTKAFQAMTVTCARCHNHKFDAISQTDFYALYGIFTSTHPAVIDANAADDRAIRSEMRELKDRIRRGVGEAWLATLPPSKDASQTPGSRETDTAKLKWFASGKGISEKPSPSGEFAIANEGEKIIERIHPRGWFSGLLSTKDGAVLVSPRFESKGGTLWMRSAGEGGARARYIVQNYPRTGTIHKAVEFKTGDAALGWRQLDLEYWKGDEIFIQCTTAADMPAEAKQDERSWFGITEWRITPKDAPPPDNPKPEGDIRLAVSAWINGTTTDSQAELLDSLLRAGKLPNDTSKIANAAALLAEYRRLERRLPAPVRVPGVMEADATDRPLFVRGDHKQPAEIVQRRFLDAIDPAPYQSKDSGRLQLAEDLADLERNPLTARVIVNRVWHHVFGRGIVSTTDNFGRLGELPTHPELLDHLARHFIHSGGSIKDMIRLLVTSRAFQRDDRAPAGAMEKDPDNKLLGRWTVRRLEAEAIRDSILHLTGALDPAMGGESVGGGEMRRSIYVKVIRNNLDDFLTAFDAPVPGSTRGNRDVTNVPAQSLTLLNDPRLQGWAAQWARRALTIRDNQARASRLFVEAFGRKPSAEEIAGSVEFVSATNRAAEEQRQTLEKLESEAGILRMEIESILGPARDRLSRQFGNQEPASKTAAPEPFAEWDFEDGGKDLKGRLPLSLQGNARIEHGALILDGGKSLARSAPLPKTLKAKTLEAWVILDHLDQRGGGVITVQDTRGEVFDSIVFAEKEARCWVPGSDHFKRSKLLEGPAEEEAAKRLVHLAVVYEADGTVRAYRDGVSYGKSYLSEGPAVFRADESEIQLGCRHGDGGGNRMLTGRIHRARIYDRALTPQEVTASRHLEKSVITEHEVLESLDPNRREMVKTKQARLQAMSSQAGKLREQVSSLGGEERAWASLALSLINAKEFIYLK